MYIELLKPVIEKLIAYGGQIVKPPNPERQLTGALLRDPMGNVLGIWQQGDLMRSMRKMILRVFPLLFQKYEDGLAPRRSFSKNL
jgi:hypothetical protein